MLKSIKTSIKILCICLIINLIISVSYSYVINKPIRSIHKAINNAKQARIYAFKQQNTQLNNNNITCNYNGLKYFFNKDKKLIKIAYKDYYNNYNYFNGILDYILTAIINSYINNVFARFSFISLYITLPCYSFFILLFLIFLFIKLIISKFR